MTTRVTSSWGVSPPRKASRSERSRSPRAGRRQSRVLLEAEEEALRPVLLAPRPRLDETVTVENDNVARPQPDLELVVDDPVEGPEGQARHRHGGGGPGPGPVVEGVGEPGVGDAHRAVLEVEERVGERAEEAFDPAAPQGAVDAAEEVGRRPPLEGPRAYGAGGEGGIERGGDALAGHVAGGDAEEAPAHVVEVVEVAAELARGAEVGRGLPALARGRALGEERVLDVPRDPQLAREAHVVLPQLGDEPRVLDRTRHLARERDEHLHVLLGEAVERRRLEVEDADDPVLVHERDDELGARLRHEAEVARVLLHVAHEHRLTRADGRAAQALADRQPALLAAGTEVDGLAQDELLPLLVEEQDPERLVVDHALDDLGEPLQEDVEVEDRRRLLADLVEAREEAGVPARLAVERRVLDRDREVAREDQERRAHRRREGLDGRSLDVEDADEPPLREERDRELGDDPGEERDVARVLRDVGHEDRRARLRGGADDPLADRDAEARGGGRELVALDVGGDEEALAVREKDVEDAVVDDAPEPVGDRAEELVGLEDGGDVARDREELGEELARQRGCGLRVGAHAAC